MNSFLTFSVSSAFLSLLVTAAACGNDVSVGYDNAKPGAGNVGTAAAPLTPDEFPAGFQYALNCGFPDGGSFAHFIRERTYDNNLWETRQWSHTLGLYLHCAIEKKNGCQGLYECLGYNPTVSEGPCEKETFTDVCEGTTARGCDRGKIKQVNCARYGGTCSQGQCKSEKQIVDDAREAAFPAQPCTLGEYAGECADGAPTYCDRKPQPSNGSQPALMSTSGFTRLRGARCDAAEGLACVVGHRGENISSLSVNGEAVCQGTGSTCPSDTAYSTIGCEGSLLRRCASGREKAPLDCSQIGPGVTCVSSNISDINNQDKFQCGLAAQCFEEGSTCEGTILTVCNGGRFDQIDCQRLGFDRCYRGNEVQALCVGGSGYPPERLQAIEAAEANQP